jgi:hypothetical protein
MNFVYPAFLYALSALSIPILIHLFNFRRYKKLYFSNVRFLEEVVQESRSRSRLKHLLVLLCRLLFLSFLIFAFCQPYFNKGKSGVTVGAKAVSIFIDNSFPMEAVGKDGTLLDEAKNKALLIAQQLGEGDKVQIITQDFDASQEHWLNGDKMPDELKSIKSSSSAHTLGLIMQRQQDNLLHSGCPVKESYIISCFQKTLGFTNNFNSSGSIHTNLIPVVAEAVNNVDVDSCWFNSPLHLPGKSEQLLVRFVNYSSAPVDNSPVKLLINGTEKAVANLSVPPFGSVILPMTFTPAEQTIEQGEIKINDYPITFDNSLFFSFRLSKAIPVLLIYGDSMKGELYLDKLYGNDSLFYFNKVTEDRIDYSGLNNYRLIILDGIKEITTGLSNQLLKYIPNGGNLLVIPPASGIQANSYRDFLGKTNTYYFTSIDTGRLMVNKLNYESEIYSGVFDKKEHKGIDLPYTRRHYRLSNSINNQYENIVQLEKKEDLLDLFHFGKGDIYVLTVPLVDSWSNLAKHALFVPTFYNIGLYSSQPEPLYYQIGGNQPIVAPVIGSSGNILYKIQFKKEKDTLTFLPERRTVGDEALLFLHNEITTAGNYNLKAGDSIIAGLSYNYNRIESQMSFLSPKTLDSLCVSRGSGNYSVITAETAALPAALKEKSSGAPLWKYCIIIALLFLACEEAVLRMWKE